jgi:cell wall assembly regulator SMI1
MEEIWERIDSWLKVNAPKVFDTLQLGASDSQIEAVEHALSIQLPEDVKASYRIHNGEQLTSDYRLIPELQEFLSLERIQAEWKSQKEVLDSVAAEYVFSPHELQALKELFGEEYRENRSIADPGIRSDFCWWYLQWIPLTCSSSGDHYCLDLAPSEGGTVGQIITWFHDDGQRSILAPSFRNWLEDYAAKLESGEYVFSEKHNGIVTLEFLECCKKLEAEQEKEKNLPPRPRFFAADTVVTAKSITIGIYDGWKNPTSRDAQPEDKDEVTIALNGELILQNIMLDSTKQFYNIELVPEVNTITVTLVRAAPERFSMPFVTIDESLIYRGKPEHQFGFSEEGRSASFTISYLPDG